MGGKTERGAKIGLLFALLDGVYRYSIMVYPFPGSYLEGTWGCAAKIQDLFPSRTASRLLLESKHVGTRASSVITFPCELRKTLKRLF
ncbi:hypothetical protein CC2G_013306 [Coprinopsis cinerea AmutBmut pab1-1]|nr:hypothetical protein CC2G_013306 [Coprinopsis cinerea AmutBmut pab1-1]